MIQTELAVLRGHRTTGVATQGEIHVSGFAQSGLIHLIGNVPHFFLKVLTTS